MFFYVGMYLKWSRLLVSIYVAVVRQKENSWVGFRVKINSVEKLERSPGSRMKCDKELQIFTAFEFAKIVLSIKVSYFHYLRKY